MHRATERGRFRVPVTGLKSGAWSCRMVVRCALLTSVLQARSQASLVQGARHSFRRVAEHSEERTAVTRFLRDRRVLEGR